MRIRATIVTGLISALAMTFSVACGTSDQPATTTSNVPRPASFAWTAKTAAVTIDLTTSADITKDIDLIATSGVDAVRIPVSWRAVEPQQGRFDWTNLDTAINSAASRGLGVMAAISDAPDWTVATPRPSGSLDTAPSAPDLIADFATTLGQRYKGQVSAWEIWYGANSSRYFGARANIGLYCDLLKNAYTALKRINDKSVIITAPTVQLGRGDKGLSPGLFASFLYRCSATSFDAIGMDPSTTPPVELSDAGGKGQATDQINVVRSVMTRNNDTTRKIYFSRFAVPTGSPGGVTTAAQQKILLNGLLLLRSLPYTGAVVVYKLRDTDGGSSALDRAGLLTSDYAAKPAWSAFLSLPRGQ